MTATSVLDGWQESEKIAEAQACNAAENLSKFFDATSTFYHVALEANAAASTREKNLNSATCQIASAVERCSAEPWALSPKYTNLLQKQVSQSRETSRSLLPEKILPLRTFGILPVFSTAYATQYLASSTLADSPQNDLSLAIALKRLFIAAFSDLIPRAEAFSIGLSRHPFISYHVLTALQKFGESSAENKAKILKLVQKKPSELFSMVLSCKGEAGYERKGGDADFLKENTSLFIAHLSTLNGSAENIISSNSADEIISQAVAAIEEHSEHTVALEIARSSRQDLLLVDPPALGFSLLALSQIDMRKHHALISQGLSVLFQTVTRGQFLPGRPFFSDGKGRTLVVSSPEIANAAVLLAIKGAEDGVFSLEEVSQVLSATQAPQQALVEERTSIKVNNGGLSSVVGWCSDRFSTGARVESWTTAHAMQFFHNRVKLLRWAKRMHVFAQYQWKSFQDPKLPTWDQLQDPDEGTFGDGVKSKILELADRKVPGVPIFLLYGPPGTSKTTLATSLASKKKWDIIFISPSDFVSDSLDKIENRSREIFRDLMRVDRAVVVFDEINSLLRDRDIFKDKPGTIIEFVVPALLPKLQDFHGYVRDKDIAVFFLTNYFESVDLAIRRTGRIDAHIPVLPYSRSALINAVASQKREDKGANEPAKKAQWELIEAIMAKAPCNFVYQDLKAIIQEAGKAGVSDESSLVKVVSRFGLSPQTYMSKYRSRAGRELCRVVARVFEIDKAQLELEGPSDGVALLKKAKEIVDTEIDTARKFLLSNWTEAIVKWTKDLEGAGALESWTK